ncbi:MAG: hypothetical protein Q4P15_12530 [Propionibacteriaceae bacterium]|nr:hypothetical protein [Propionibacteriaceae bacterium]
MKTLLKVITSFIVGGLVVFAALAVSSNVPLLQSESETSDSQVIRYITRKEQVVLMSLGIEGISQKSDKSRFLGMEIPGSDRASFLQYKFSAKLGIEGKDVEVSQTGDSEYLVRIPEFIFIGHDDVGFKMIAEKNGLLSAVTPKIDSVEAINEILNKDTQAQYIQSNLEVLEEQARLFYSGIITSIDPDIAVRFEFLPGSR